MSKDLIIVGGVVILILVVALVARGPNEARIMLDRLATETKGRMRGEAPYKTGALSKSITVTVPDTFTRVIEPMATNARPGNPYGKPVETGSRPGYMPNVFSISQYFGVDMKIAFAIAKSIQQRGTPANPFVSRTYNWIESAVSSHAFSFLNNLVH